MMSVQSFARRAAGGALAAAAAEALAVTLAGCGGQAGSVAGGDPDPLSTKLGNLLAFNSTKAPAMQNGGGGGSGGHIDCPIVQVEPGQSSVRVGGEDSSSVRYQISIGDVARDCTVVNNQLLVRVGVETRTVTGPAGGPGTYTAPLRVSVRKVAGEQIVASRTYNVGGAVGSSGNAINTLIAEPLAVPFINEHAADDYEIVLAFGEARAEPKARRNRR